MKGPNPVYGHDNSTKLSPQAAWEQIKEGNERFTHGAQIRPNQDAERLASLQQSQNPSIAVLSCSDSRVPVEIVLDQGVGDVFVVRTAGPITDLSVLASLEFAVDTLGVSLVVVLGHENCGAVKAAYKAFTEGELPTGFQRVLVEKVSPSIMAASAEGISIDNDKDLHMFEDKHIQEITQHLVERSHEVQERIKDGKLGVVGLRYSMTEGGKTKPVVAFGVDIPELIVDSEDPLKSVKKK